MYKNLSLEALGISGHESEVIELALSNGFRGTDFSILEFRSRVERVGIDRARRLIDSAKLRLSIFDLPISLDADAPEYASQLEAIDSNAELAAGLGCSRCRVKLAGASDFRPYHENFELHRQRLTEVTGRLQSHGICLGLELALPQERTEEQAFEFICQLDAALVLLGTVRAENLGLIVDLWQLYATGGQLDQLQKLPISQIVGIYLSDAPTDVSPESLDTSMRLLPGTSGAIDSAAALAMLAELGYDGPVTPTPDPSQTGGQTRDQIVRLASEALTQVWKNAGLSPAGKLVAPSS